MNIKDLFGSKSNNVTNLESSDTLNQELESAGYAESITIEKDRFTPFVDYSDPANFAKFGSAYKYYTDTITNIYRTYPYDGSLREKQEWRNNASDLDIYFIDFLYPKYKGFISLGSSSFNSFATSSVVGTSGVAYKSSPYPQFVYLVGDMKTDPNAETIKELKKSNVYDVTKNRQSNLEIDIENGNTVEFYFKYDDSTANKAVALFDNWNGSSGTLNNRLLLEMVTGSIYVTYKAVDLSSNTLGINRINLATPSGWNKTVWNHYAFTFKNTVNGVVTKLFVNGELADTYTGGSQITSASLGNSYLTGTIGAYQTGNGDATLGLGSGSVYGSFDEFRYWKTERTQEQIYKNMNFAIGGGANTDDYTSDLGIYYKFNEGILSNSNDAVCLDYSGRINNGFIYNYTSDVRISGSAFDNSLVDSSVEKGDLIINPANQLVQDFLANYQLSGTVHDQENVNSFINLFPSWIIDEEDQLGKEDFRNLIQIISSYFDTLHVQTDYLTKFKDTSYPKTNEKVHPEFGKILNSAGFQLNDIFSDITLFEEVLSRNDNIQYEKKIEDIKNSIYKNIFNNLALINKTKGTEKSFRNLVRCFGIDEEILPLITYAENYDYTFEDKRSEANVAKKVLNFNKPSSFGATIYVSKSVNDSEHRSYLKGVSNPLIPYTVESEIIFPKKFSEDSVFYFNTEFTTASLFGVHQAKTSETDLTWETADVGNFQVYAVRPDSNKPDGYFLLTSNGFGPTITLTSSVYPYLYNDNKWNFAVRLKNSRYDVVDLGVATGSEAYTLEFYGVDTSVDQKQNEFLLTASINHTSGAAAVAANKRIYAGAHRLNFTSSVLQYSDIHLGSVKFWYSYIDNDTVLQHAFDPNSYGVLEPNLNSSFGSITGSLYELPKIYTLALNWNFDNTSPADSNGELLAYDISSGSVSTYYGTSFGTDISKKHNGKGENFYPNDASSVLKTYLLAGKKALPETVYSLDMVQVLDEDVIRKSKTPRPTNFYFAFEKSMYRTISDEMMKLLSSTTALNTIVGAPVNKWRDEYKDLAYLKQLFFEKVGNTPDLEKYIEFYKWIDSSIFDAIKQLVPATAKFSNSLSNVVESHLLERNKINLNRGFSIRDNKRYSTIYPLAPSNALSQRYEDIKPPSSPSGIAWAKKYQTRLLPPLNTPSNPSVDTDREAIRKGIYKTSNAKVPTFYDLDSDSMITLKESAIQFADPVQKLSIAKALYSENIKSNTSDTIRKLSEIGKNFTVYLNGIKTYGDINVALNKQKVFLNNSSSIANNYGVSVKPNEIPFTTYIDLTTSASYIANQHEDNATEFKDSSLQGPFTQTHVGGNKHRHAVINSSDRQELYKLVEDPSSTTNKQIIVDTADLRSKVYRNVRAKRPVNITNILTTEEKAGNYSKTIEFLNTNGRFINNKDLVEKEISTEKFNDIKITNAITNSLNQSRDTFKTIIVNKFSSPGETKTLSKAFLDPYASELALYNSLNNRNLDVRTTLNVSESATSSLDEISASLHKVNKNPYYKVVLDGTSSTATTIQTDYDNNFVIHQIPRSDKQYSWITASLINNITESGYISKFNNLDYSDEYVFQSGSIDTDFIGLNYNLAKQISINDNEISVNTADPNFTLNKYLLSLNGPYGFSSWKQLRVSQNPVTRKQKFYNINTAEKTAKTQTNNNVKSWLNPPYTKYTQDIFQMAGISSKVFELYGNYFSSFYKSISNPQIDSLGISISPQGKDLDKIIEDLVTYKDSFIETPTIFKLTKFNEIAKKLKIKNKQQLYSLLYFNVSKQVLPNQNFTGLGAIRGYKNFDDWDISYRSVGANAYGPSKLYKNIRSMWRTKQYERARNIPSPSGSFNFLKYVSLTDGDYSVYNTPVTVSFLDTASVVFNSYNTATLTSSYSTALFALDNQPSSFYSASYVLNGSKYTASVTSSYKLSSSNPYESILNPALRGQLTPYTTFESADIEKIPSTNHHAQLFFANKFGAPSKFNSITNKLVLNHDYIYTVPYGSLYYTYDGFNITQVTSSYNTNPRFPFYDSYEDFFKEFRAYSDTRTVLPEFKISNISDALISGIYGTSVKGALKGIINNRGSYLTMFGVNDDSDIYADADAYPQVPSDNLKQADVNIHLSDSYLLNKVFDVSNIEDVKIKLTADIVKKFLPSKGFYPSDRIVELTNKFKQSFIFDEASFNNKDYLNVMQPLFGPGILLNSIKASIAVDWPVVDPTSPFASGFVNNSADLDKVDPSPNALLINKFAYRVPFESLLDFNLPINLLQYADPTNYTSSFYTVLQSFNNRDYTLAMHNFLSEVPNFFLENGTVKSISSKVIDDNGISVKPGYEYVMDVTLNKAATNKYTTNLYYDASLYGPPSVWWYEISSSNKNSAELAAQLQTNWPAYLPYAPPYFNPAEPSLVFDKDTKAVARITFKTGSLADSNTINVTLEDILRSSEVRYFNAGLETQFLFSFTGISGSSGINYDHTSSVAFQNAMNLSSSLNLFKKVSNFEAEFNQDKTIRSIRQNGYKWIIQPKFESPSLWFPGGVTEYAIGGDSSLAIYQQYASGLWTSYGVIPKNEQGINLTVKSLDGASEYTSSLAELVGFTTNQSEQISKKIGVLAPTKKVKEAIVLIPYVYERETGGEYASLLEDGIDGEITYNTNSPQRNNAAPLYFSVNESTIEKVLAEYTETNRNTYKIGDFDFEQFAKITKQTNNSIIKTIKKMTEFVLPPHLDWLRYPEVKPFVMYILDTEMDLGSFDLSNIWQGIMPAQALNADHVGLEEIEKGKNGFTNEKISIEHNFGIDEFFHGKIINTLQVRFKAFKIKQRAEKDYYKMLNKSSNEGQIYAFGERTPASDIIKDYSYNWPYDYFSLIQLAKIDVGFEVGNKKTQINDVYQSDDDINN